jgi:hypothetical protein
MLIRPLGKGAAGRGPAAYGEDEAVKVMVMIKGAGYG